jgi:hypothetical protein
MATANCLVFVNSFGNEAGLDNYYRASKGFT